MPFYEHWSIVKRLVFCSLSYALIAALLFIDHAARTNFHGLLWLLFVANCLFLYVAVALPLQALRKQYVRFNQGYDTESIFARKNYFTLDEKLALEKIEHKLNNQEVNRLTNRQAQYLALQNQINPHFLYNTLEAIRGDALSEGMESVANVTEALATFFRYTISNMDKLVSLEEELNNADNYFAIQNYRFGDRVGMEIEIEPGSELALGIMVPKLTLQPIIENAIIHGLENQVGPGKVSIHIATDSRRLLIGVTDDGVGIPEPVLNDINRRLAQAAVPHMGGEKPRVGGIALINVDNRIKILFGEQYGIVVSSIVGFGTRVEITLPIKKDVVG